MAFGVQYLTNCNGPRIVLYRSFGNGLIFSSHSVQVPLCNFGRAILGLYSYVIFVIGGARLQISSFTIRIGFTFLIFIGIRSPLGRFFGLYKDFTRCLFCYNAITSPITYGRHVFGILIRVVRRGINSKNCPSLNRMHINLFRPTFASGDGFAFIHRFRHGARANGSKASGRRVRFSCRGLIVSRHGTAGWIASLCFSLSLVRGVTALRTGV